MQDLRDFVEASAIPTVMTLRGLGALPANHPQSLGMLGMHGTRAANMAVQESDLLLVLGARFDDRATGKLAEFAPFARVVHIDADAYEISKLRSADVAVPGNVGHAIRALRAAFPSPRPTRTHGAGAVHSIAIVSQRATTHRASTSTPRRC